MLVYCVHAVGAMTLTPRSSAKQRPAIGAVLDSRLLPKTTVKSTLTDTIRATGSGARL